MNLAETPVFVIGLKNAPRQNGILDVLHQSGIAAQHWEGVDGRDAESIDDLPWQGNESYDRWRVLYKGEHLSFTEMAAYLSHYRLLRHIQQQGGGRL